MPTLLELAGAPFPDGMQGSSLLPLLRAEGSWRQRPAYFETSAGGYTANATQYKLRTRALRTERWKLLKTSDTQLELFDLREDPREKRDVYGRHLQVADSLHHQLNEWVLATQPRATIGSTVPAQSTPSEPGHRSLHILSPAAGAGTPGPSSLHILSPAAGAGTSGPSSLHILSPAAGDTLHYAGASESIELSWSGPEVGAYTIEYEVGEGVYHMRGVLSDLGRNPTFGPFHPSFWNSLVLYNPWKFRVVAVGEPDIESAWVTFYLAPASGENGAGSAAALSARFYALLGDIASLVAGLTQGAIALALWTAHTVSTGDLTGFLLIGFLVSAIAVRLAGRRRATAWGIACVYVLAVYATVPTMRHVWDTLEELTGGAVRHLGATAVAGIAIVLAWRLWRRVGSRPAPYIVLAAVAGVYAYVLHIHAQFPAERLHLVQYGLVGFLLFRALRLDLRAPVAYGVSLGLTALVGLGDEVIQWVLPDRFFQLSDVQLNAISGGLGLIATRLVVGPVSGDKEDNCPEAGDFSG